jgi:catechol 2,3-dioxygenase
MELGVWMSANVVGHEVACMRDALGEHGRLHHVAMYYGVTQHNIDAAEMFREHDIQIEAGPDKHGVTQGQFLYVFEPGGNRIELFGEMGIMQFEPDYQTRTWDIAEIDTALAVGGAKLPFETYLTYGTPSRLTLADHIVQMTGSAAGTGDNAPTDITAAAAVERTDDLRGAPVH